MTFLGLLGLLFIGLKLAGVIAWSWWWVLLPLYGGIVLAVLLYGGIVLAVLFAGLFKPKRRRFR